MKKWIAGFLVLMLMCASAALAETRITVNGSGESMVRADYAIVSLGVNVRDQDALKAQSKANEVIAAIRQALTDYGLEEESINTDYMNIYAIYDYSGDLEQINAYNAGSTLAIRVDTMENVGKIIDLAFEAGANTLNGISFYAENTEAAQDEALRDAVADARTKAETLAAAMGLQITGIEAVNEGSTYRYDTGINNYSKRFEEAEEDVAMGTATVVQAAKIGVSASVSITFLAGD